MKKIFLSATAIVTVMSASAFAADLPSIKSAPTASAPMWTGFYAGMNAGYGFGVGSSTNASANSLTDPMQFLGTPRATPFTAYTSNFDGPGMALSGSSVMQQSGFIGGGQVGYNYLISSRYLLGLETDIQGTNISGSKNINGIGLSQANYTQAGTRKYASAAAVGQSSVEGGVNWLGTIRARAGYLITPTILVYGTAGLSYGGVFSNVSSNGLQLTTLDQPTIPRTELLSTQQFSGGGRSSDTLLGYSAGGGFEWMSSANWSLKAEALYYNLGNMNVATSSYSPSTYYGGIIKNPGSGTIGTSGNTSLSFQGLIARAGVNYHFDPINSSVNNSFEGIHSIFSQPNNIPNSRIENNTTWNGFYLGMNAGYGFGTNNSTVIANDNIIDPWTGALVYFTGRTIRTEETTSGLASALSGIISMKQGGFIGGGQAGYNYKLAKNYIVGLETDIQGTSIRGSNATTGFGYSEAESSLGRIQELYGANSGGQTSVRAGLNWIGTVRGRAGYLWTPSLLTYATAGLAYGGAYANVKNTATILYFADGNTAAIDQARGGYAGGQQLYGPSSNTDTLVGYNVGGGFELLLNQNWSLKTEALYYNLGSMNIRTNSFAPGMYDSNGKQWVAPRWITGNTSVNFQGIITRAGLNYHFDFGKELPVVAKY